MLLPHPGASCKSADRRLVEAWPVPSASCGLAAASTSICFGSALAAALCSVCLYHHLSQASTTCPPCLALPAAKTGPLAESGFQANLSALLVRLGVEHPHHSLYQVGNRCCEDGWSCGLHWAVDVVPPAGWSQGLPAARQPPCHASQATLIECPPILTSPADIFAQEWQPRQGWQGGQRQGHRGLLICGWVFWASGWREGGVQIPNRCRRI